MECMEGHESSHYGAMCKPGIPEDIDARVPCLE